MLSLRLVAPAVAAAALGLLATQARATTFTLDLTGSAFTTFTQDVPGFHLDRGIQLLGGLDDAHPVTVDQGDTVEATITFDQAYTIPASVDITSFALILSADLFPGGVTDVTGETHFFLGGSEVVGRLGGGSTTGQLANAIGFFPPDNGPITFDSITSNFTIGTLGAPATLTRATALYTLFTAVPDAGGVPEPSAWALMLLGFGGLGSALRARRRLDAGAALRT